MAGVVCGVCLSGIGCIRTANRDTAAAMRGVWEWDILDEEDVDDGYEGGTRCRFATRRVGDIFEGGGPAGPRKGRWLQFTGDCLAGADLYNWERWGLMVLICLGFIGVAETGEADRSHRFGTGRRREEEEFIWLVWLFLLYIYLSDLALCQALPRFQASRGFLLFWDDMSQWLGLGKGDDGKT